ncbi:hypothetical protein PIB30_052983 [Stylosanthes scabra]|uniref:Uncharacterized protein n=1 Tax=Stylosanthes scabra TaxID=79078 RepID=A0ABU6UKM8_9FABA|nr:hypothetical protein [Stylosanthes scabra]
MPAPDVLLPFLEEAGFGHAIQLWDFVFDARSFLHLWSAGGQRPIRFTCRGVSAPSPCRMWRTTWVSVLMGIRRLGISRRAGCCGGELG